MKDLPPSREALLGNYCCAAMAAARTGDELAALVCEVEQLFAMLEEVVPTSSPCWGALGAALGAHRHSGGYLL